MPGARYRRGVRARALVPILLALSLISSQTARAEDPPVRVAEVSTSVGREEIVPALKQTLILEAAKVQVPKGKRFVVSASLTKLETKPVAGGGSEVSTTCVISIAVRDGSGTLRGMTSGRGTLVSKRFDKSAEKTVLDAAVRGAMRALPGVMGS